MQVLAWLSMMLGVLAVLRAVTIVVAGSSGRFRFEEWLSLVVGFGLCLLGQALRN